MTGPSLPRPAPGPAPGTRSGGPAVRPVDRPVDLVDLAGDDGLLWMRDGAGLVGLGARRRIPVGADPAAALGALAPHEVAFCAVPFTPGAPFDLVVPEVVVRRHPDGSVTVTGADPDDVCPPPGPPVDGGAFRVTPSRDPDDWMAAVAEARRRIRSRALSKVVLARRVDVTADRPLRRAAVLRRLAATYPSCMIFAVDGFVGASPELLVGRRGDRVRSHPLAGTAPRGADPADDARTAARLLGSDKDRWEHQLTIDAVCDVLLPLCSYLDFEAEPTVVTLANVCHLGTLVHGRLSEPAPSALELALALHPTPAVGGVPGPEALALIAELEGEDRGRFAGPVGWVDGTGDGELAVGIRSAELDGNRATLFAGVGVVADSDPAAELAETQAKLAAMLGAIVRP